MALRDYLFGRQLATDEEGEQRVGCSPGFRCSGSMRWDRRRTGPRRH